MHVCRMKTDFIIFADGLSKTKVEMFRVVVTGVGLTIEHFVPSHARQFTHVPWKVIAIDRLYSLNPCLIVCLLSFDFNILIVIVGNSSLRKHYDAIAKSFLYLSHSKQKTAQTRRMADFDFEEEQKVWPIFMFTLSFVCIL